MSIGILRGLPIERTPRSQSAGLSSKLPSPILVSGPVLMLALDGAEKSLMHFRAAAIGTGNTGGDSP